MWQPLYFNLIKMKKNNLIYKISMRFIICLALILTYSSCFVYSFADTTEPNLIITSDKNEYMPGDTITFTFKIDNIPEKYISWQIRFNAVSGLTYQSYTIGDNYKDWTSSKKGSDSAGVQFSAVDYTNAGTDLSGDLCQAVFKVNEDADLGEHILSTKTGKYNSIACTGSTGAYYFSSSYSFNIVSGSSKPSESSYTANITADKTTYNVGDTVKLTAALTPAQVASLASGSMKISYDKDALDFSGAVTSDGLTDATPKATAGDGTAVVSFTTTADKALSVSKDTALNLATFSFTAKKAGTADFEVTEAIADEAVDGALKSATVNKPESKTTVTIEAVKATCDSYGSDYKLIKYVSDTLPATGKAYAIGGSVLSYVPAYATGDNTGKYVFVGLVTETPADLTVSEVDGSYDTIQATGDANGDSATNITDAQTVIYMIASKITSATEGAYGWLNSDVNGDCVINALDAQAIQYFVHYGAFGQFN